MNRLNFDCYTPQGFKAFLTFSVRLYSKYQLSTIERYISGKNKKQESFFLNLIHTYSINEIKTDR